MWRGGRLSHFDCELRVVVLGGQGKLPRPKGFELPFHPGIRPLGSITLYLGDSCDLLVI